MRHHVPRNAFEQRSVRELALSFTPWNLWAIANTVYVKCPKLLKMIAVIQATSSSKGVSSLASLTWPLVALVTVIQSTRQSSGACIRIKALVNICARIRGPPIPFVDIKFLNGGGTPSTRGVLYSGSCQRYARWTSPRVIPE